MKVLSDQLVQSVHPEIEVKEVPLEKEVLLDWPVESGRKEKPVNQATMDYP